MAMERYKNREHKKVKSMKNNILREANQNLIIAEIGVNHNGKIETAFKLIDAAKKAGADAVKFQTFRAEKLATQNTPKVQYQINNTKNTESHYEMLKRLELSELDHIKLKKYCDEKEIEFLSTPYDLDAAKFLLSIGVKKFKTASADIVDIPLHEYIAGTQVPTIISTGMANIGEIEKIVNIYKDKGNSSITLLHCTSNYPCSDKSVNMKVMSTIKKTFGVDVGYSDHTVDSTAAIMAIAMGSNVIEKHLTLDNKMVGPDHKASINPEAFGEYVIKIRKAEIMLGDARKKIQEEEVEMSKVSRKSITICKDKKKGEILVESDLVLKRPGIGLQSTFLNDVIGRKLKNSLKSDHILSWSDLC